MSKSNSVHLRRFGRTGALIFTQKSSKRGFALFSKRPQCHIFSSTVSETYGIDVSNDVWTANDIFFLTWTLFSTTVSPLFSTGTKLILQKAISRAKQLKSFHLFCNMKPNVSYTNIMSFFPLQWWYIYGYFIQNVRWASRLPCYVFCIYLLTITSEIRNTNQLSWAIN